MPYRGQRRQYNPYGGSGGRLSDLMLAQGEQQANLAREQGDIWGQFLQNVGQTAGDTLQAYQKDERERPAREQAQRIADRQEDELTRSLAERDRAEAQAGRMESYGEYLDWGYTGNTFGVRNPEKAMQKVPPEDRPAFAAQYKTLFDSIGTARKAAEETMGVWAESVVEDVDEMMANPRLFGVALAPMVKNNMIPEDIAAQMYQEAMDNPRSIPQHIQGFLLAAGKLTPQEMETHVLEAGETLVGVTGDEVQELYTPTVLPEVPELDYQFVTREDGSVWAINKNDPSQRVLAIEATGQLPPQEKPSFTNRLDLRKAFASETSAMAEIDDAVQIMNTATQMMDPTWAGPDGIPGNADDGGEHNIPAATQMILVKFQKVLDPGSVVRESEYARSASGQSILGSIQAFLAASKEGGILTAEQLQTFANAARGYAQSRQQDIDKVVNFYAESAQRDLGIAADDALEGVRLFDMWRTRNPVNNTGNERIRLGGQQ
jgi:hypothetical protein